MGCCKAGLASAACSPRLGGGETDYPSPIGSPISGNRTYSARPSKNDLVLLLFSFFFRPNTPWVLGAPDTLEQPSPSASFLGLVAVHPTVGGPTAHQDLPVRAAVKCSRTRHARLAAASPVPSYALAFTTTPPLIYY